MLTTIGLGKSIVVFKVFKIYVSTLVVLWHVLIWVGERELLNRSISLIHPPLKLDPYRFVVDSSQMTLSRLMHGL
jgi:hypothetical protein